MQNVKITLKTNNKMYPNPNHVLLKLNFTYTMDSYIMVTVNQLLNNSSLQRALMWHDIHGNSETCFYFRWNL